MVRYKQVIKVEVKQKQRNRKSTKKNPALLVYFHTKILVSFFFLHYGFRSILLFWCVKIKLLVVKFLRLSLFLFPFLPILILFNIAPIFLFFKIEFWSREIRCEKRDTSSRAKALWRARKAISEYVRAHTHTYDAFHIDVIKNNYGSSPPRKWRFASPRGIIKLSHG